MANERGYVGIVNCGTPAKSIAGLMSLGVSPGVAHVLTGGGDVDPKDIYTMDIRSAIALQTSQISLVGSFGISGSAVVNFDAYFQKHKNLDTREIYSASKHLKVGIAAGFCLPGVLRCDQGGVASLDLRCHALSADGDAAAVVVTKNQAMPASGDATELFTLGPVTLNGTEVHCEGVEVDFGIEERVLSVRGEVYPTLAYIVSRRPVIRIRSPEIDVLDTYVITGTTQSATDSVIVFRKMTAKGTRVAAATAEHVSITVDDGEITIDNHGGDAGDEIGSDILLTPVYDGTNAILVVSATATFT